MRNLFHEKEEIMNSPLTEILGMGAKQIDDQISRLERAFRAYLKYDHSNAHAKAVALQILDGKDDGRTLIDDE